MDSSARTLPSAGSVLAVFMLVLALAACSASPPRKLSSGEQCLADLHAEGVRYVVASVPASTGPCAVVDPVRVESAGVPWNQPAIMTCALADRVDRFFTEAVEPLAERHLGTTIARMDNFGAYSCRREAGGRWSEHAAGRAIDVRGFLLANGETVSVEHDWDASGRKGAFLHALARRACDYFNAVLTPESDSHHWNHLHLDLGPYRLCQIGA